MFIYSALNIYSGNWFIVKSNTNYKKGTLLKNEFEIKELVRKEDK